mmetsp:Transcript_39296/g.69117  ORF Transcript_39296/g.69117 Transcript_39296/m.69117 type:complete len:292 (-) Transcript_39296:136-1011(-)
MSVVDDGCITCVEEEDGKIRFPAEIDNVVLASYSGPVFYPSGIRLSALQQCHADDILSEVYKGCYRRNQRCELSPEDKVTFKDPRFEGADTYGEVMPESFLDILWKLGAKPGERFYDLGSGTGKLLALAWLVGLRVRGIELSRARAEIAWRSIAEIEARCKVGSPLMASFPQTVPGALECTCNSLFDVDFSDADLVLFSSVMFSNTMVAKMARIARCMKPGSRIISKHNLENLGQAGIFPEFRPLGEIHVDTTWSTTSGWMVHEIAGASQENNAFEPQNSQCPAVNLKKES